MCTFHQRFNAWLAKIDDGIEPCIPNELNKISNENGLRLRQVHGWLSLLVGITTANPWLDVQPIWLNYIEYNFVANQPIADLPDTALN